MLLPLIGQAHRYVPFGGSTRPVAVNDTMTVLESVTTILNIVGNDQYTGDKASLTVEIWNGSIWTNTRAMTLGTATVRSDNDIDFAANAVASNQAGFFDYRITDAIGRSNTGRVNFTVANVAGTNPVAVGNTFSTLAEKVTTVLDVVANDIFVGLKSALTVQIWNGTMWTNTRAMALGTATVRSDNDINFTAASVSSNQSGFFDYRITDANGISNTATVNFTVLNAPVAPIAENDSFGISEETTAVFDVVDNDTYAGAKSALTLEVWNGTIWTNIRAMAVGTVTVDGNRDIEFAAHSVSADTVAVFSYRITDSAGTSNTADVTVTVVRRGTPPTTVADTFQVNESATTVLDVVANDRFSGAKSALTVEIWDGSIWTTTRAMSAGTVTVRSDKNLDFVANAVSSDTVATFSYRITDSEGTSASNDVTVTVRNSVPTLPVAVGDTFAVSESTTAILDVVANDTFTGLKSALTVQVWNGSIWTNTRSMTGGTVTVRSDKDLDFVASAVSDDTMATFDYRIIDANGTSPQATVTVNVVNIPNPPLARPDVFSVNESATTVLDVVANDRFTGLKSALVIQVWNGTVWTTSRSAAGGTITVRSDKNLDFAAAAVSQDTDVEFSYRITDAEGTSAGAAVTVTVLNSAPTLPLARDNVFTVRESTTAVLDVVANDRFTGLKSALTVQIRNGSDWGTSRSIPGGTVTVRSDKDLDFVANAVAADTTGTFDYRIIDSAGTSNTATVTVTVDDVPTGGGVGPIEPVNGSALQVTISVGTSARQRWHGYGWGTNGTRGGTNSEAYKTLPAATTHVRKLCEDLNATVFRSHTPEDPGNFITVVKPWWDLVKNHGVDTLFTSSYIYRTANGDNPPETTVPADPIGMANGIDACMDAGINPATWACTMQNEPEGAPQGKLLNSPPGTNGRYGAIVRTHQKQVRDRLNTLGREEVITLGLEWRHPTDSNTGSAEFDDFESHGEVGREPSDALQDCCIHIYNKAPNPALYDNRYLTKGRAIWSTETGDMHSPRTQAIFLAGVNHGTVVEIAHIGITASSGTADARQFLLLGNGTLNPWYNGVRVISRALLRGTRIRRCTSSDRPSGLNTTNADLMIWTQQLRNPRQFVIAGKRTDGRWIICAVSHAYGADTPQQQFAGGHYGAITQQLTVTVPELAGIGRTWTAQRASITGTMSSASYNMNASGQIRFTLAAGDTLALVTTNAA